MSTEPRLAASVILVRENQHDGDSGGFECYMHQRAPTMRVAPSAWVFPGGAYEPEDNHIETCALRECFEETGWQLECTDLKPFARWITPADRAVRFDTHFFCAIVPEKRSNISSIEFSDEGWATPAQWLSQVREKLMLPTLCHLVRLATFANISSLWHALDVLKIEPTQPVLLEKNGQKFLSLMNCSYYPDIEINTQDILRFAPR